MDIEVKSNLGNAAISPAPIFNINGVSIMSPINYEDINKQRRLEYESDN